MYKHGEERCWKFFTCLSMKSPVVFPSRCWVRLIRVGVLALQPIISHIWGCDRNVRADGVKALVVLAVKRTRVKGTRKSRLMPICFVHLDCIIAVQHRWRIGECVIDCGRCYQWHLSIIDIDHRSRALWAIFIGIIDYRCRSCALLFCVWRSSDDVIESAWKWWRWRWNGERWSTI